MFYLLVMGNKYEKPLKLILSEIKMLKDKNYCFLIYETIIFYTDTKTHKVRYCWVSQLLSMIGTYWVNVGIARNSNQASKKLNCTTTF